MKGGVIFVMPLILLSLWLGCASKTKEALREESKRSIDERAVQFLEKYISWYKPLEKIWNLAQWNALTTGENSAYDLAAKVEIEIKKMYSNKEEFNELEEIYNNREKIKDPLVKRQIELAYYEYKRNQGDPELMRQIVELASQIQKEFNTYRGKIGERIVTANEIEEILKTSTNSEECRLAYEASKGVGPLIAQKLQELVRLRNRFAVSLGYKNYWEMEIILQEYSPEEITSIFDELAKVTDEPFRKLKEEIDLYLAKKFKITPQELMPWHYGNVFFQEVPSLPNLSTDLFYKDSDIKELAKKFYLSLGFDVNGILNNSDLYEREKKDQHAYCFHIDREGDIRILANLKNNEYWMGTIMHELGHAIYDQGLSQTLPWLLKQPAHIFTTEAVAEFFGMLVHDPQWLKIVTGKDPYNIGKLVPLMEWQRIADLLIFARWSLVMVNFERSLYENPDQDLNELWWSLVERYQLLKKGDRSGKADWATKTHLVGAPVYYHNYMIGRIFVAQLKHKLKLIYPQFVKDGKLEVSNHPEIGNFLKEELFKYGASYPWQELVKRVTGEPLTANYFAEEIGIINSLPTLKEIVE